MEKRDRPVPAIWQGMVYASSMLAYIVICVVMNFGIDYYAIVLSAGSLILALIPMICWVLFLIICYRKGMLGYISKAFMINAVIIGALIASLSVYKLERNERRSHFDYNIWVSQPLSRGRMVDDLLRHNELQGLTKAEVIERIGLPDANSPFQADNQMVYELGQEGAYISLNRQWLLIDMNGAQIVTGYAIHTD
ncbi:hypothetical protein ACFOLF_09705 [Paenibacillus sepulcri]|uniref:Lipoprotein SmpA/OmlA domain-containing protein n=1 Tax=Paenibacillus sepulcri TaxID=359917 RepID=A0ABS7CFZ3_9BACL|nr:hypothetical protein [Paenibacillus sepulcri]